VERERGVRREVVASRAPSAPALPRTGGEGDDDALRRLLALLDPDSFVRLGGFAVSEPGAADSELGTGRLAVGFGSVSGRDVAVYAAAPNVLLDEVAAERILRVQELALRNRLPIVAVDEPIAPRPEEGIASLAGWASVLAGKVAASGVIPQISVVTSPGGTAAPPHDLADFTLAIGELGRRHLADFTLPSEAECWRAVRRLLSYLPSSGLEPPPRLSGVADPEGTDPELDRAVPEATDARYDVRELISRLLDGPGLMEVQSDHAANAVVGFGRLDGYAVGVVANQPAAGDGALDPGAAAKAARFVRCCDAFNLPLLTLVDSPGWSSREDPGEAGPALADRGAGVFAAYVEATVPKLTVIAGRAYAEGYRLMAPKEAGADLNLAWPRARIAAVSGSEIGGGDGSIPVVDAYAAAERGFIDRVIEPRETRRELIRGLGLCLGKTVERPARKHRTGAAW
jgi:propionyl-CoA carboxylase beta chain